MNEQRDLSDRLFRFAVDSIKFLRTLKNTEEIKVFKNQLTKSATSTGANYEESQAASSRKDFLNKINISLREMRESNFWIRIIQELKIGDNEKVKYLVKESDELKKILGSISSKISNTK